MAKKVVDVDNELRQFKSETGDRFAQVDQSIGALRGEVEKMKEEIMAPLKNMTPPPPPTTPLPTTTMPPQSVTLPVLTTQSDFTCGGPILMQIGGSNTNTAIPPPTITTSPLPMGEDAHSSNYYPRFSIEAFRHKTQRQHAEIMAILMSIVKPTSPPPPPTQPPLLPLSAAPTQQSSGITNPIPTIPPLIMTTAPLFYGVDGFSTSGNHTNQVRGKYQATFGYDFIRNQTGTGPYGTANMSPWVGGSGPPRERIWLPGADHRLRRLKMPLCKGEDAYGLGFTRIKQPIETLREEVQQRHADLEKKDPEMMAILMGLAKAPPSPPPQLPGHRQPPLNSQHRSGRHRKPIRRVPLSHLQLDMILQSTIPRQFLIFAFQQKFYQVDCTSFICMKSVMNYRKNVPSHLLLRLIFQKVKGANFQKFYVKTVTMAWKSLFSGTGYHRKKRHGKVRVGSLNNIRVFTLRTR